MKIHISRTLQKAFVLGAGCMAMCSLAHGAQFYLRTGVITNTMPDGRQVVMWGFAQDTTAGSLDGVVTVPGPKLTMPLGDTNLTIHLDNKLAVPVSIVIPGQVGAAGPVPARSPADGRALSFTLEAAPGGTADYAWNNLHPGTFLYRSGSHPAVQVQMGLYGELVSEVALQQAYPGVSYYTNVSLLYSEIDPVLHDAVASDNYGTNKAMTSVVDYAPKYFLINGRSFTNGSAPLAAGFTGGKTLLRFLNAGLKTHVPIVNGAYLQVVAEDGFPYPYARDQYSVFLAAGKTLDVLFTPTVTNTFIYDRMMGLVNGTNSPGGMLIGLSAQESSGWLLTLNVNPVGSGSITSSPPPGAFGKYTNGTIVILTAITNGGYTFTNWTGAASGTQATVQVTVTSNASVTANFIAPISYYALTLVTNAPAGGTVSASPAPTMPGGTYLSGTLVTLTAVPNTGYAFGSWSGAVGGSTNSVTVTMDGNKSVTATFLANLALASRGSTITGSNGANWSNLIDGVTNGYTGSSGYGYTVWTGVSGAPGTMTLDLKALCTIYDMKMLLWNLDSRYYRYKIEASVNGTSWTLVVNRITGNWQGWQDMPFATPIQARYLRLTGTYDSANANFHVVEWQVFGTAPANLALASRGSTITGSNGANWSNVIDGVTTGYTGTSGYGYTLWTGVPSAPGTMTLDLKGVCTISSMRMLLWNLDSRYYRYKIEASADGSSWTQIVDRTTGTWRGWQDLFFGTPVQAQYLRLTGTYDSANNGFHVVEWQVYGTVGVAPGLAASMPPLPPGTKVLAGGGGSSASPLRTKTFLGTGGSIGGNLLTLPDCRVIVGSGTGKDGKPLAMAEPVEVVSQQGKSDWANAVKAVDLDETTAWAGTYTNGAAWLAVTYATPTVGGVEIVLAGGSSTNLTLLGSVDGKTLFDLKNALVEGPVILNHIWLVFPAYGTDLLPVVKEVYVREQK